MFAPPVAKPKSKAAEPQRTAVVPQRHVQSALSPVQLLQRRIGNQALMRLLAQRGNEPGAPGNTARLPGVLQAKLKVGAVNDPLEHEADRVAGQVMRMPEPRLQCACPCGGGCPTCQTEHPVRTHDRLQIKPDGPEAAAGQAPLPGTIQAKLVIGQVDDPLEHEADRVADQVMRMPAPEVSIAAAPPQVSRKCAECEEEEHLQKKEAGTTEAAAGHAPASVHEVLRSPGQPLDAATRGFMEPRFGQDFSRVEVYTNDMAAESARSIGALAYTTGSNIAFGAGHYQPGTDQGRKLIAHELTHVVQQRGGTAPRLPLPAPTDATERETGKAETQVLVSPAAGPHVQRFESFEHVQLGDTAGGPKSGLILLDCHSRDLPDHAKPVTTWPAVWQTYYATLDPEQQRALKSGLTYGEIVALSGDMYDSFQSLNRAPLREVIDLIPLIRSRSTTTKQLQAATGGRYLTLAQANIGHFSNVPVGQRNRDIWRRNHIDAIAAARSGNSDVAWGLNAAGDHFLTDAFSGGHLRVERAKLHAQGKVGDIQSKILHDLDNQFGVDVTNDRGDAWPAYGDEHLNDKANAPSLKLALEAVELSKKDIADALSQKAAYPVPTATTVFAAERLIPRPVSMTKDRWTGRLGPKWPWSPPTDFERATISLVVSEAPGVASELTQDDDRVRSWINRMDVGALSRQSESEKVRMINTLLSFVVDTTDMDAIERLLGSVVDATEMGHLRSIFLPRATSLGDFGLRARFRIALDRKP